jgi:hypothetical protein
MYLFTWVFFLPRICFASQDLQSFITTPPPFLTNSDDPQPKPPGKRIPVEALYNKRYSEQTFIGTHDAVALRTPENGWSLSGNQYFNLSVQLESGVRLIQAQGHIDPNGSEDVRLCHFNCALMDGGSLHSHLTTIRNFLDANPHEVITLLFVNTGPPLRHWLKPYFDLGLDIMSYIPPPPHRYGNMRLTDWPRLADLVATNRRLITFLSSGADENTAPFLLPEFDYIFETDFRNDDPRNYPCAAARPWWHRGRVPADRLALVNHFLYADFLGFRYPNATYANTTNGAGFRVGELGEHAARCRTRYGRRPNFLLVDFFNEGHVFDVDYGMNAYD